VRVDLDDGQHMLARSIVMAVRCGIFCRQMVYAQSYLLLASVYEHGHPDGRTNPGSHVES
jgi:hypothetical protein